MNVVWWHARLVLACGSLASCQLVFQAEAGPGTESSCPGYFELGAGRYRFGDEPKTFRQAELDCFGDGTHTHLAVLASSNATDLTELNLLVNDAGARQVEERLWIGLVDNGAVGSPFSSLRWVTLEQPLPIANQPPWGPNEPSNSFNRCAVIEPSIGRLIGEACAGEYRYYCECDAFPEAAGHL